jgi:hypothetical protein
VGNWQQWRYLRGGWDIQQARGNLAVWGKLIFVFMAPTAGFVFLTVTLLCVISINLSHTVRKSRSLAKGWHIFGLKVGHKFLKLGSAFWALCCLVTMRWEIWDSTSKGFSLCQVIIDASVIAELISYSDSGECETEETHWQGKKGSREQPDKQLIPNCDGKRIVG